MLIWDDVGDICMFWQNKAPNLIIFLMQIQWQFMINASLVSLFDFVLQIMHELTCLLLSVNHIVQIQTTNLIALLICQFGTIWVIFACFDKIRRQIDLI
jgi:hypothetical protein